MREFMIDVQGGTGIVRTVPVAVALFVLFGTGVELAFESLAASLFASGAAEIAGLPLPVVALVSGWLAPVLSAFFLALFMIEIAAIGVDRCAGKERRMHLVFRPGIAWTLLVAGCQSLLLVGLLALLMYVFSSLVLASFLDRSVFRDGDTSSILSSLGSIGITQQSLLLIVIAFGISRFALIPLIARHHDVGFGEAWTRQTHGFGHRQGSLRNRFFRVFLVLLLLDSLFVLAVTQVVGLDAVADAVLYPVSILLMIVWPVAVASHMVRSQPRSDDGAATT